MLKTMAFVAFAVLYRDDLSTFISVFWFVGALLPD